MSLGGQLFATLRATAVQDDTSVFGGHTRAKPVTALANKIARLESTFHQSTPRSCRAQIGIGFEGPFIQKPLFTVALKGSQFAHSAFFATIPEISARYLADVPAKGRFSASY
jgi:hypothetical protein